MAYFFRLIICTLAITACLEDTHAQQHEEDRFSPAILWLEEATLVIMDIADIRKPIFEAHETSTEYFNRQITSETALYEISNAQLAIQSTYETTNWALDLLGERPKPSGPVSRRIMADLPEIRPLVESLKSLSVAALSSYEQSILNIDIDSYRMGTSLMLDSQDQITQLLKIYVSLHSELDGTGKINKHENGDILFFETEILILRLYHAVHSEVDPDNRSMYEIRLADTIKALSDYIDFAVVDYDELKQMFEDLPPPSPDDQKRRLEEERFHLMKIGRILDIKAEMLTVLRAARASLISQTPSPEKASELLKELHDLKLERTEEARKPYRVPAYE